MKLNSARPHDATSPKNLLYPKESIQVASCINNVLLKNVHRHMQFKAIEKRIRPDARGKSIQKMKQITDILDINPDRRKDDKILLDEQKKAHGPANV